MNFSFVHEFDIDAKSYWEIFWTEEYSVELYKQLKMRSRTVTDYKEEGGVIRRSQRMEPSFPVPSWASSVIKDTAYTEHDTYHKDRSEMEVRIEPALMKDRFHMGGSYIVTPIGEARCRREFRGEVRISVPLIGGKIEKLMVDQLRDAYEVAARVTRDFIARRKTQAQGQS
jgi:hypothetical protein